MKFSIINICIICICVFYVNAGCKKDPYYPDFEHAGGYVIEKEHCKIDTAQDYWLIDLSYVDNPPNLNYGDTITIGSTFYSHMVKTNQLIPQFQLVGKKVSFDFHLSADKVNSTGCNVVNPVTYFLKSMEVIASGEIH